MMKYYADRERRNEITKEEALRTESEIAAMIYIIDASADSDKDTINALRNSPHIYRHTNENHGYKVMTKTSKRGSKWKPYSGLFESEAAALLCERRAVITIPDDSAGKYLFKTVKV